MPVRPTRRLRWLAGPAPHPEAPRARVVAIVNAKLKNRLEPRTDAADQNGIADQIEQLGLLDLVRHLPRHRDRAGSRPDPGLGGEVEPTERRTRLSSAWHQACLAVAARFGRFLPSLGPPSWAAPFLWGAKIRSLPRPPVIKLSVGAAEPTEEEQ